MRRLLLLLMLIPGTAGAASLTLTWTDNSANENGFRIERRLQSASSEVFLSVAVLEPNVTTYTDTGLLAATGYCYRVVAFNEFGETVTAEDCETTAVGGGLVSITTSSIANGQVGVVYSQVLAATGGDGAPYTYSLDAGSLPAGVTVSSGGTVSGTPEAGSSGPYTPTFEACDASLNCGTRQLSMFVESNSPQIQQLTLVNAQKDQAYSTTLTATGGVVPYSWSKTGTLCDGLSLSSGGVLSGTPTVAQMCSFTVIVTDDFAQTHSRQYSITVGDVAVEIAAVGIYPSSHGFIVLYEADTRLSAEALCTVSALRVDDSLATATQTTGKRPTRRAILEGLEASTTYTIDVDCSTLGQGTFPGNVTLADRGVTVSWEYSAIPSARLAAQSAAHLLIEYNRPGQPVESVTNTDCSSGCTQALSLVAGAIYEIRHTWLTAASAVLAVGAVSPVAVP